MIRCFVAFFVLFVGPCLAQSEAWPQPSRWLDSHAWYSADRPTTDSLVLLSDAHGAAFGMLSHEVTNKQWQEFVDSTSQPPPTCDFDMEDSHAYHELHAWRGRTYPPGEGGLPVVFITRDEADGFCRWRTEKTGVLHRLPTDEEWKNAAGAHRFPWGDSIDGLKSLPVGRHLQVGPDPFYAATDDETSSGIKFMLGNVREFTSTDEAGSIVLRGAAYDSPVSGVSLGERKLAVRNVRSYNLGFRYVVPMTGDGLPQSVPHNQPTGVSSLPRR